MKQTKRILVLLMMTILLLSTTASAKVVSLHTEDAAVRETITQFFDTYMAAMVSKTYPDFSTVMKDTTNTQLYKIIINYEVDSAILYNAGFEDYDYTLAYTKLEIAGAKAQVDVEQYAAIQFESFEPGRLSKRHLSFSFDLEKDGKDWRIANLYSNHEIFTGFLEELEKNTAAYSNDTTDIIQLAEAQVRDWLPELTD